MSQSKKFRVTQFSSSPGEGAVQLYSNEKEYHTYQHIYLEETDSEVYFDGIRVKTVGELLQKLSLDDLDKVSVGEYSVYAEVFPRIDLYGACTHALFTLVKDRQ